MIRVLIVDDSVTQREIFRRLLADDELTVVAEARNGREAVSLVKELAPDVVLMDIHMPDMDGIAATRAIMRECPVPVVIASATLRRRDIDLAMQAYAAGAVAVIEKPEGAVLLHLPKIGPRLRAEVIAASKARLRARAPGPVPGRRAVISPRLPSIGVIGVCASTGGPPVLLELLSSLPRPYPLPVLVVQHISHGFEEGFARWLAGSTGQAVGMASQGQRLDAGVWLAPTGHHLLLASPSRLTLAPGEPSDIHCPSGDPLFESLARHLGARAAGVVLTGMGDDGAAGLLALKRAGGLTVIQDEASCLIWGMPKAAQALGAATQELPPAGIAALLTQLATPAQP